MPAVGTGRASAPRRDARGERGAAGGSRYTGSQIALIVIATLVAVAAAHFAEPFLVPLVTGILLSYTLRPLVSLLELAHVPRVPAAALVVGVLVALISATAYAIRDDVNDWVAELPSAARKLRHAVADSERQSPGPMSHMKAAAAELDKAAAEAAGQAGRRATAAGRRAGAVPGIRGEAIGQGADRARGDFRRVAARALPACRRRHLSAQGREDRRRVARPSARDRRGAERDRRPDPALHADAARGQRPHRSRHLGRPGGARRR